MSVTAWAFEQKVPGSTDSTPYHTNNGHHQGQGQHAQGGKGGASPEDGGRRGRTHRRTQSLPPETRHPARLPQHRALGMMFAHPVVRTYRFHSGLAGDINVQELMAESKLAFAFPQQLL